jgi:hypothetical protein
MSFNGKRDSKVAWEVARRIVARYESLDPIPWTDEQREAELNKQYDAVFFDMMMN